MTKRTRRAFSYETKLEIARRYVAGETALGLAAEFDLSSPQLVTAWARSLRDGGAEALRPRPKGRAPAVPDDPDAEVSELTRLRRENERLRAEVAYLGKLRALREHERR
ncbi:helix-turn-helix domain-containing protein [Microbacterium sp. SS28]|uniref:helix-turn-helix domain-containing protein n=1 Tax=Microbacterium sp. SS28 TaxID=2919948 RepID=UPI001FAB070C|nr:helix-turn-helix domain-containing protein [Microbacterium sp. SS28]